MLKRLLTEVDLNKAMEDSLGPVDWRKIHREDYKEPSAPLQGKNNNDNSRMEAWDDIVEDDSSYWSHSSSFWDDIWADNVDTFCTFQEEMELAEQDTMGTGDPGWKSFQPKGVEKSVKASHALAAKLEEETFCAEPASQWVATGYKPRHY